MAEKRIWELLAKQFGGQITEEELRELQVLLQEQQDSLLQGEMLAELKILPLRPTTEDQAAKQRSLGTLMEQVRGEEEVEMAPVGMDGLGTGHVQVVSLKKGRWLWAAVGMVVLVTGWMIYRKGGGQPGTGGDAASYDRIVTRTGSKTLINLPDSSTVVLNSACQFAYNKDFGVRKREMQLTGEAYFDIHGNPEMPLVVHAGNVIIRVLGTTFNVRAYAEDSFVEATLVRGVIEVSLKSDPERKILLRPNEKIVISNQAGLAQVQTDSVRLKPREEVIRVTQVAADPKDSSYIETAWLKDKLVFRKESLGSLARRMERWYQVHIVFADTSQQSILFTGAFERETVGEALDALRHSSPFSYNINGRTITISRNK